VPATQGRLRGAEDDTESVGGNDSKGSGHADLTLRSELPDIARDRRGMRVQVFKVPLPLVPRAEPQTLEPTDLH
jgi:hypothetical protein